MQSASTEQLFVIRKGGYYYRPNAQGYTSSLLEAGRYPQAEAIAHMEHCDPGEITIFPAPAVPASPTLPQDIAATAERIVLEHIASGVDMDGRPAGARFDDLAAAIAAELEIARNSPPPVDQLVATADASTGEALPGLITGASSHARGSGSGRPLTPADQMVGSEAEISALKIDASNHAADAETVRRERDAVIRENDRLRAALTKISSPTQSTDLLWWQVEARAALSAQEVKG